MPKLTCKRTKEIYEWLKTCTAEEFLNSWRIHFEEIFSVFVDEESSSFSISAPKKASCLILEEFFRVTIQFPAVSKEFASEKIQILIPKLTSHIVFDEHILLALRSCLKYFPAACGRSIGKHILPYIFKFFDSNLHNIRRLAGDCFAYLPTVGPGGEKRSKHAENWAKQMKFLLFTAHKCFHLLTDPDRTGHDPNTCQFSLKSVEEFNSYLPELTSLDVEKLINRTNFCLAAIKFMQIRSTEFEIQIPLMEFIRFLRCITHSLAVRNDYSSENFHCSDVCETFLDTFSVVPSITGYSLAPYCAEIFDLFETILHKSTKIDKLNFVKLKIYLIFDLISSVLGAASKFHLYFSKIWRYCRNDFQTVLSIGDASSVGADNKSKQKQKKQTKKLRDTIDVVDQFVVKTSDLRFNRMCIVACSKMLTTVVRRVGPALKPGLFRELQQFVCKLLLNVQISRFAKPPYDDGECRLGVYSLLNSLILCQNPGCPPALQCALSIFDQGARDTNVDVARFCDGVRQIMVNLTKPRVPYLESIQVSSESSKPVEIDEEENFILERIDEPVASEVKNGTAIDVPEHQVVDEESDDDDEEDRIVVNIGSESDENYEDEVQIVSPSKRPKMDADAVVKYDSPKKFQVDEIKVVENLHEDVSEMLSDFVDELADN